MSTQENGNNGNPDSPSGTNSKDAMFEPKPKPKMIRVLTVLAYVLSVSMAAILLSIYYIFMWDGRPHLGARRTGGVEAVESHLYNHSNGTMTKHSDNLYNISEGDYSYNTTTASVDVLRMMNVTSDHYEEELNRTTKKDSTGPYFNRNTEAIESEVVVSSTVPTTTEEASRTLPDDSNEFTIASSGTFIRKMYGRYDYDDS